MQSKYLFLTILGVIFFIGCITRMYNLSSIPVGFHIDEASLGYNAYSLLLTGKDENNNSFPLYIDMFGDNRPSGYHYLAIPFVRFFGLNEFSTRLPGALFGSLSIIALYFFVMSIFQNKKLALLSSFFLAIAPWHIVQSRASAEPVVALFFILLGASFFIRSLQTQEKRNLWIGSLLFSVSYFFYHTPRVFVPSLVILFIATYVLLWYKKINKSFSLHLAAVFFVLVSIAMVLVFAVTGGTGRFTQVNIFGALQTKLVMDEQVREDGTVGTPVFITRVFHNKIINYTLTFVKNYLEYFSGSFLFLEGGLPKWYSVPGMGLMYLVLLPFLIVGIIFLATSKKILYKLPLAWLLVAPLTAALTVDDVPNINRTIVLFPVLEVIAAYGLIHVVNLVPQRVNFAAKVVISALILFNFAYFLHMYSIHSQLHKNWYRNEGFGEMVKRIKKSYDSVDTVVVTKAAGGIYPLLLFYMEYDPKLYQQQGSSKDREYSGFGKFFFVPQACPSQQKDNRFPKTGRILYVNKGECGKSSDTIYRKDATPVFSFVYE